MTRDGHHITFSADLKNIECVGSVDFASWDNVIACLSDDQPKCGGMMADNKKKNNTYNT
jgi:hypothetical protein